MKNTQTSPGLSNLQQGGLIILRIIIGWHFFYEGLYKLVHPGWSAESYLIHTRGFLSGFFHWMAANPSIMKIVDLLNIWGLIFIGLGLFLGVMAGFAIYAGILLLSFYYLAYPPFNGYNFGLPQEGNYLLVDKTFIEMVTLIILSFFPETLKFGLWSLLKQIKIRIPFFSLQKVSNPDVLSSEKKPSESRRNLLKNISFLPILGGFTLAYSSSCKKDETDPDAFSGSTITLDHYSLGDIKGEMPKGVLYKGKAPVSRLIMGTNHFSGNSHGRDLVYMNQLFKAYNSEKKIIETYLLAEKAGINLFYFTPLLSQYKKIYGGKFQTWINVAPTKDNVYDIVNQAIDKGVDYIYIQGAAADRRAHDGEIDVLARCIDYIKEQGYPAGLGAHTIQVLEACYDAGIDPDFYYKTMHHDNYWSAHPMENRYPYLWSSNISEDHNKFHDNMWCLFPEKTVAFVQKVNKPVIGFKVLAAGAIHPRVGFQWAFDNGADFIDVGMFDYQVIENVNATIDSVEKAKNRSRKWY